MRIDERVKNLIESKLNSDYECSIYDKDLKETFFIKSADKGSTYSIYRGCNTLMGDTTLDRVVCSLINLHNAIISNKTKIYIEYWGGCEEVFVVDTLHLVPEGARYVCTIEDSMDIYESVEGVVYGVTRTNIASDEPTVNVVLIGER